MSEEKKDKEQDGWFEQHSRLKWLRARDCGTPLKANGKCPICQEQD